MSFRANCFFELEIPCFEAGIPCFGAEIPCFAAGIPCSFPEQGIHAKTLILLCDHARQPPETGESGVIFEDSLLNSLLVLTVLTSATVFIPVN